AEISHIAHPTYCTYEPICVFRNDAEVLFLGVVNGAPSTVENHACVSANGRSEEHTSELQSRFDLVCRLLLEKKNSVQLLSTGGIPSACGLLPQAPACGNGQDSPTNLNGSSIFQGVLNALPNMFYLPSQQRFDPLAPGSLFANQNYLTAGFPLPILPFTLPLGKNFVYGYARQANLTIEREIAGSWKFSLGAQ